MSGLAGAGSAGGHEAAQCGPAAEPAEQAWALISKRECFTRAISRMVMLNASSVLFFFKNVSLKFATWGKGTEAPHATGDLHPLPTCPAAVHRERMAVLARKRSSTAASWVLLMGHRASL